MVAFFFRDLLFGSLVLPVGMSAFAFRETKGRIVVARLTSACIGETKDGNDSSCGIVIPIALGGAFIRTGNFFNSEIVGIPTNGNWGVIFHRLNEVPTPRYPVQLFEAIAYYIVFFIIFRYYWKMKGKFAPGMLFGFFFVTVFGARFLLEFWKEGDKIAGLNRGHWLSIPIVIIGLIIWFRAISQQRKLNT